MASQKTPPERSDEEEARARSNRLAREHTDAIKATADRNHKAHLQMKETKRKGRRAEADRRAELPGIDPRDRA